MLTHTLTAFVFAATPQVPIQTCKLAGPAVEAHWSGAIPPASRAEAPLRVVTDVPLPGSASRFDYQSLEPASGRLFVSHMGAGQLVVVDVRAGRAPGVCIRNGGPCRCRGGRFHAPDRGARPRAAVPGRDRVCARGAAGL